VTAASRAQGALYGALAFSFLAFGVSQLQPRLAAEVHEVKETSDVYPFPPPPVLRLATLGYVAATTDILWGKLLVENGSHWSEHRSFPDLEHYLDAIIALDPAFHPFYEYVDSLLCYRPIHGTESDAREARAYLEAGTKILPDDAEVWMHYGQFVAFMGPSYLMRDEDRVAWRREGALAINHAVELGADVDRGVAASAMLDSRLGEREASIRFLERAYALTDDDDERAQISARLELMHAGQARDRSREVLDAIEGAWRAGYPFLDRGMFTLVAPVPNVARCVGPAAALDHTCARDWEPYLSR
jgi:tetratricopeptide (TPR) repeat protein